ncbi:hypothetical protein N0O92_07550 [Alkalihalobacillus sp. MEB130]|uniref:hypothetical protein n=1 Tax=Alkalihalobacillus sp. MEB130 TaxID=2976704 RepID=UPI0028DF2C19|nr:hypothetical protein [Alkalihalobacillus sp. MEB130]MDT8860086.1 hypothetical protein [Alkalihalobacillus sp. MEB130]
MKIINERLEKATNHSTAFSEYIFAKQMDEKKAHVLILAHQIRDAVAKQQTAIHAKIIEETPQHHNLSNEEIATLFTAEKAVIIQKLWSTYETYLHTHWLTKNGTIKSVFRGRPDDIDSEVGSLHHSSKLLLKQLDHWLTQLNSSS